MLDPLQHLHLLGQSSMAHGTQLATQQGLGPNLGLFVLDAGRHSSDSGLESGQRLCGGTVLLTERMEIHVELRTILRIPNVFEMAATGTSGHDVPP